MADATKMTTAGDVATSLISLPLAFFAWRIWGDPGIADAQVVAPLLSGGALGIKKAIQSSWIWENVRRRRALDRVRELRRAIMPHKTSGEDLSELRILREWLVKRRDHPIDEMRGYVYQLNNDEFRVTLLEILDIYVKPNTTVPRSWADEPSVQLVKQIDSWISGLPSGRTELAAVAALTQLLMVGPTMSADEVLVELKDVRGGLRAIGGPQSDTVGQNAPARRARQGGE